LKKSNSSENSKSFTGLGSYHAYTYSVVIFLKYLILFIPEEQKIYSQCCSIGLQQIEREGVGEGGGRDVDGVEGREET